MKRNEIINAFAVALQNFGKVITEDLTKKYETKPCLYLAVLRSESNDEIESGSLTYIVEILYLPDTNSVQELNDLADSLTSVVLSTRFADAIVRNIEIVVDAIGSKSIFCNFEFVCFTN